MITVAIQVDDVTLAHLRRQAAIRSKSVENYATDLIRKWVEEDDPTPRGDVMGADEPAADE